MLCMLTLTNIFFHKMQNSTQPACLRKMHVFEICDLYEESRFNSLHKITRPGTFQSHHNSQNVMDETQKKLTKKKPVSRRMNYNSFSGHTYRGSIELRQVVAPYSTV